MSGNVWMFSDEIDDEDLEFMRHDYVTYNMACEYYRLGIKPVVRMAHEAGAVYKFGKYVLIRRQVCIRLCAGRRLLPASAIFTGRNQTDWVLGNASKRIYEKL